ncbi:DNA-3-methyladenine glycosylase [Verrucomicrobium sp. GAS474]|uniref:DNA-3-methyladenine glycosylase n=1 Tax=Verrucomicrobium sp. GAS474 TaxID=1882831 RepID=UPI00087A9E4F|nr:DNA-3-methyladenine glycosylase [Verrucomicrobium sp. GAS474]SDU28238.1 DNA-3-methyladenine glycosylase [Verrucomicrobium sp. GAS474]
MAQPSKPRHLPLAFYRNPDPVAAARSLLGKRLVAQAPDGTRTAGIIVETEAYGGAEDKACHGFAHRRTARTEPLFAPGGIAYVYLCYGLHSMLNVVTGPADSPMATLLRGLRITEGKETVARRRPGIPEARWADGPGKIATALALTRADNRLPLTGPRAQRLSIEETGLRPRHIVAGPRIGIDYAGPEWAGKPWRFLWKPEDDGVILEA